MRKIVNIYLILIGLMSSCNNKPIIIDPDLLKYDWISENGYRLYIKNDSLMFETLTESEDPISSYKISYDTLFIFSSGYIEGHPRRIWKFNIIKIDSLELVLKVLPPSLWGLWNTMVFNKQINTKKNDLKIERIEYSVSLGHSAGATHQSLIIDSDSILYHYGSVNYSRLPTKHKGLSKYKLSPVEFSKIQNKLNSIDWSNIESDNGAPGGGYSHLFIKTPNDSIEIRGSFGWIDNKDFEYFMEYLFFLEHFLNLNPIEDQEVSFRYNWNY